MSFLERLKKIQGKRWLLLTALTLTILIYFSILLLSLYFYWNYVNYMVSFYLNFNLNLVLLVYLLLFAAIIYNLYLIHQYLSALRGSENISPSNVHKIVSIIVLILFFLIGIILIYFLSGQLKPSFQIVEFYSIFIFPGCVLLIALLWNPTLQFLTNLRNLLKDTSISRDAKYEGAVLVIFSLFALAYMYPIVFIPANVYFTENLPEKPDLIAHRGGSQIGPENTIEVAEFALDFDIVGWEVDIGMSYDGVPFLMHDTDLKRTTNVEEVFPEKKDDPHYSFTWSELRKLNAGSWYAKNDPFGLIRWGLISQERVEKYDDAKIPSFEEALNFTRENDLILDFDTKTPPQDHPYHANYTEILFNMTLASGIDLENIMIPSSSETWSDLMEARNVTEIWTYKDYINTGDGYSNTQYRNFYETEFPVMVYTINNVERFVQLWSLGVTWVKTDTPHLFYDLEEPFWVMRIDLYIIFWASIYGIALAIAIFSKRRLTK